MSDWAPVREKQSKRKGRKWKQDILKNIEEEHSRRRYSWMVFVTKKKSDYEPDRKLELRVLKMWLV